MCLDSSLITVPFFFVLFFAATYGSYGVLELTHCLFVIIVRALCACRSMDPTNNTTRSWRRKMFS